MMYLIVRWDGEKWVILHYSHDPDDVIRQYTRFLEQYGDVSLFIDERVLEIHETRMAMKDASKQFKEIRNAARLRRLANKSQSDTGSVGTP